MNESPSSSTNEPADSRKQQRLIRWILFAVFASSLIGLVSVATNIASYRGHTDPSGTTATVIHHTATSRVVLSAVTVFQFALAFGLVRRSRIAWRAAFALPLLWAFLVGVIGWPQIYTASPDSSVAIPLACLGGLGIWQTVVWRKQWVACEGLFQ